MTFKLPAVNCARGAPMGRADWDDGAPRDLPRKFYLRRINLDSGGYDSGGAYWGHGAPLYLAETVGVEGEAVLYLRAATREAAKVEVKGRYPAARFFR